MLMLEIILLLSLPQSYSWVKGDLTVVLLWCMGWVLELVIPWRSTQSNLQVSLTGTTKHIGHSGTEGKDFRKVEFQGGGNERQGVSQLCGVCGLCLSWASSRTRGWWHSAALSGCPLSSARAKAQLTGLAFEEQYHWEISNIKHHSINLWFTFSNQNNALTSLCVLNGRQDNYFLSSQGCCKN